jgi:thymidylate synthase
MSVFIRHKSVTDAWRSGLRRILEYGEEYEDERGLVVREYRGIVTEITDTSALIVPSGYIFKQPAMDEYARQFLSPFNPGFAYTYGNRLRAWQCSDNVEPVDQIQYVVESLKRNAKSRRCTAVTWIPPIDTEEEDIPCLVSIDFKLHQNRLYATVLYRSQDWYGAYPANVYGITSLMKEVVARVGGGVETGSLCLHTVSAHVYQHDFDRAQKVLASRSGEVAVQWER